MGEKERFERYRGYLIAVVPSRIRRWGHEVAILAPEDTVPVYIPASLFPFRSAKVTIDALIDSLGKKKDGENYGCD